MPSNEVKGDITRVLQAIKQRETVSEEMMAQVYQDLRHLAAVRMAREAAGQNPASDGAGA